MPSGAVRRSGLLGKATSPSASAGFPYGQIELIIGDSIAEGVGAGTPGSTDWPSRLVTQENRLLRLPDPGLSFVEPGGGAGVYAIPQFSAIGSNCQLVAGYGDAITNTKGVKLNGTLGSGAAANSLTDNRVFGRAIVFYLIQANSDGIGVSLTGGGGTVAHTIDGTANATGGNGTIGFYDTGVVTPSGGVAPTLSLTRQTHVSGAGGTAPIILGVRYYAPGNPGTSGVLVDNLAIGGTTAEYWVQERTWESHLAAISAQVRRVIIALGGNDYYRARSFSDATISNGSATIGSTSTAQFSPNDIGRPITGTHIPAGTTITAVASATSATMSANATGTASGSYTMGQFTLSQITTNLQTIINRIRAIAPNVSIVLIGEHHVQAVTIDIAGFVSTQYWANTFIPAIEALASSNGCAFVNLYDYIGSVGYIRTVSDGVTNGTATVTSASAAFSSADLGSLVTGTNIPALSYIGVVNSATSIGLSSSPTSNVPVNATGSGSGRTLKIGNDVFGLTIFDGLHLGDPSTSAGGLDGQQQIASAIAEQITYGQAVPAPLAAQGLVAFIFSGTFVCPASGTWRCTAIGAGGGGGGGSTPSSTIQQCGSGGGGPGELKEALLNLTEGVAYAVTIGAAGGGGPAGAAGGHQGTSGTAGGTTTFGSLLAAAGGAGGTSAAASSTTTPGVGGVVGGAGSVYPTEGLPGGGGGAEPAAFAGAGSTGAAGVGFRGGGGGGSGGANSGTGGGGGGVPSLTAGGGGAGGTFAGGSGANGTDGASTGPIAGSGGGAGGPAGTATGTAGNGGSGTGGAVLLEKVG